MEKVAGFAGFVTLAVLMANVSFCEAQTVTKYFKDGGALQLSPVPVSAPITSIVWKYKRDLLAEWVKGSIDLTYYSRFNGRSQLNTNTGALEIRNMTAADLGVYSVEINNQGQSRVYQAEKIEEVPQPVVEVKPLVCSSASPKCTLSCDGDVTKAGPVQYFWKKGDGEWEQSERNKEIINDEETQRVKTFSCRMKNPLSQKDSEPFSNLFYGTTDPSSGGGGNEGVITGAVIVVLVLVLVLAGGIAVFILYKRRLLCFKNCQPKTNESPPKVPSQTPLTEVTSQTPLAKVPSEPSPGEVPSEPSPGEVPSQTLLTDANGEAKDGTS